MTNASVEVPVPAPPGGQTVEVAAESDGGVSLRLPAGCAELRVVPAPDGPRLKALDLQVPADVRILDLSAVPEGPWVRLVGGASLERVLLPATSRPRLGVRRCAAELHLTLDAPPALYMEGAVERLDASWRPAGEMGHREVELRAGGPGRKPWSSVWLGTQPATEAVDGMVLWGLPGPSELELGSAFPVRMVEVHEAELERLVFHEVERASVLGCRALTEVVAPGMDRLRFTRCHRLQLVEASGSELFVTASGRGQRMLVLGRWDRLTLQGAVGPELRAPEVLHITLQGAECLQEVHGAPGHVLTIQGFLVPEAPEAGFIEIEDTYIEAISEVLRRGRPVHPELLGRWIDGASGDSAVQARLVALSTALEAGTVEPEVAWALRCRLVSKGRPPEDTEGRPAWMWRFPADLADRGWRADLMLWWGCRGTVREAFRFDEVVGRVQSVLGLATLSEGLRMAPELSDFLLTALTAPLPEVHNPRRSRGPYPFEAMAPDVVFARVVRGLVKVRDTVEVSVLADALATNLQVRIEHGQPLVPVLASIHQLAAPGAGACLAAIAANTHLDPEVQREALLALIAAPHPDARPYFAPPEAS